MIDQAYVGFVYECGGLEGVALSLPAHVAPREPVQFGIDERVQLVECGLISFAPFGEELGNLMLPGYACQLLCHALECADLSALWSRIRLIDNKAASSRPTPRSGLKPVDVAGFSEHLVNFADVELFFRNHPARVIFE